MAFFRTSIADVSDDREVESKAVRVARSQSRIPPVQRVALGKILFLGNSYNPLSIACLQAIVDSGYETIVAAHDPLGQGTLKLLRKSLKIRGFSPVIAKTAQLIRAKAHLAARHAGLAGNQFASLPELVRARGLKVIRCADPNSREFVEEARHLGIDVIVVAAFSRLLKNAIINAPRIACINVHPSLLPKYRGPEPYFWVLANQEKITGVTVHHMSEQLDSGDVILQRTIQIHPRESEDSLKVRCSEIASQTLCQSIEQLLAGTASRVPQDSAQGSYYSFPPKGVSVRKAQTRISVITSAPSRNNFSAVYEIDPLRDPRWSAFLDRHPDASVFHSVPWLQALKRTYDFEPIVYTATPPSNDLQNGIVFCRVNSWITGRRLVSLPFSDHCEPLVESGGELDSILGHLQAERRSGRWKYVEIRPQICRLEDTVTTGGFQPSTKYYLHTLDLEPHVDDLVQSFHKTSIRHQIRRAERNTLHYECGQSDFLLEKFYELLMLARRRHHVPPQPKEWFRNLRESFGGALQIHLASHGNVPVAAVLTLRFKNTVIYKYGGSNQTFHRLGSVPFVLSKAICDAKLNGARTFDLGRSDCDNPGLIQFKNHLASVRTSLTYLRFPGKAPEPAKSATGSTRLAKRLFESMPDSMLQLAGQALYRHVG